jgi:D-lactate dehydrogenase
MKIAIYDTHAFEKESFTTANESQRHELVFIDSKLNKTTWPLASGCKAICSFVNDRVDREVLTGLKGIGVELILLRSAGFNHVDLNAASDLQLPVTRVENYSPYAVAEHAVGMLLTLNRKLHRAYNRVRELNFSLDGLVGFDLHQKKVGVIGTGMIGTVFAQIMHGFGCKILAYDQQPNPDLQTIVKYQSLNDVLSQSDIISLHVPLTPQTHHMIDQEAFLSMKNSAILINTGRGGLIETTALIEALKSKKIAGACLDVYEEESGIFFQNLSDTVLGDDVLARLLTFPNVLITSHQAFLTHEALKNIADTTLESASDFEEGRPLRHRITL